jgi:hypothetical protein
LLEKLKNKSNILVVACAVMFIIMMSGVVFKVFSENSGCSRCISPQESDYEINQALTNLLYQIPGIISARVALIHTTISEDMVGYRQTPSYTYSTVYGQTLPNYPIGTFYQNIPLSQMQDYLPALIENRCSFNNSDEIKNKFLRLRLENRSITSFLACPLYDNQKTLMGALYLGWNKNYDAPDIAFLDSYISDLQQAAQTIDQALIWRSGTATN